MHDIARTYAGAWLIIDLLPTLSLRQLGRCIYCEQIALRTDMTRAEVVSLDLPPVGTPHRVRTIRHRRATVEHVHRRTDGGSDDPRNLVMACAFCNSYRDDAEPFDHKRRMMELVRRGQHPCGPGYVPLSSAAQRAALDALLVEEHVAARTAAEAEIRAVALPLDIELALTAVNDASFECGARLDDAEAFAAAEAVERSADRALRLAILTAIGATHV